MYADLKGKTAFVMGAGKARGIGFHIAAGLARQGVSVCLADRDGCVFERARELEAEGAAIRAFTADLCSSAQVEGMRDEVGRLFPNLDILIQCAGVFPEPAKLAEGSVETWLRTQDINVHGTFRLLHAFLPLMRERGGSVVAVASGAGKRPLPGYSGYSVSKAGLIMLLKAVAVEYAGDGIRANSICPGPVESEMVDSRVAAESARLGVPAGTLRAAICKGIPLGRMAGVDDIVGAALFLASDASAYVTGQSLNLSGGMITEV